MRRLLLIATVILFFGCDNPFEDRKREDNTMKELSQSYELQLKKLEFEREKHKDAVELCREFLKLGKPTHCKLP